MLSRPSTLAVGCVGLALYLPLATSRGAWLDPVLLAAAAAVLGLGARWVKLLSRLESRVLLRRPVVTAGRLARFLAQLPVNGVLIGILAAGDLLTAADLRAVGGVAGATLLISASGHGWQDLGIRLANRGRGYRDRNLLIGLVATTAAIALLPRENNTTEVLFPAVVGAGILLAAADFLLGLLSDLRAVWSPRGGIGVFIGTFNPVHRTHIDMVERAIRERGLDLVLVHPTVVPKLHVRALERREIEIAGYEAGMRVYRRTAKADANVDYFPTGNRFYDHRTRELLFRVSVRDAGIADRVEVVSWPSVYADRGFYGVIAEIKRRHPGRRLHGLHGSDAGGMWNRAIYDESGWIYPFPVARTDEISGTAIRGGASGMMTPTAEAILGELRRGSASFSVGPQTFAVDDGVVTFRSD